MTKKIIFDVEVQKAEYKNICKGCFFCVGMFFCQNRRLCPDDGTGLNYKLATKFEEIETQLENEH